ncbi:MAG TPA: glycosyltransferase [Chloroflexota bacterium]|nr:glycosyltransferase [Chloroflexota bacterium]
MAVTALKVRGRARGWTSTDHHVREFLRAIQRRGVAIEFVDAAPERAAILPDSRRDAWLDSLRRPVDTRVMLHFTTPDKAILAPDMINVIYTVFEATRICPDWVDVCSEMDLVIVATESSRRAWIDSGVDERLIRICPEGIDPYLFDGSAPPLPLRLDDGTPVSSFATRFLNVSAIVHRKNLGGLLRSWLRATNPEDSAVLIWKLGPRGKPKRDYLAEVFGRAEAETGTTRAQAAPILVLNATLADDDIPRLHASATHYISMSHGEGWDHPMVEAAATGLQLIAPNHSSFPAYLDSSCAVLLPSRQVPAAWPEDLTRPPSFPEDADWWDPDEDSAVAAIRAAIDGRDSGIASPAERIRRDLSWDRAAERLLDLLDDLVKTRTFWRWYVPGKTPTIRA